LNKFILTIFLVFLAAAFAQAQKIDSIFFHLYTDSLKKAVHNYINVDGKLSNGRWLPLTEKEIKFQSSAGQFEGNDLILPADFSGEKVTVTATLKSNPALEKTITIWVKKKPDDELLPSKEDILYNRQPGKRPRHQSP
jgi:hypothetical protein